MKSFVISIMTWVKNFFVLTVFFISYFAWNSFFKWCKLWLAHFQDITNLINDTVLDTDSVSPTSCCICSKSELAKQ